MPENTDLIKTKTLTSKINNNYLIHQINIYFPFLPKELNVYSNLINFHVFELLKAASIILKVVIFIF